MVALLSLFYAASLYAFLKLYTSATTFSVPAPPPSAKPTPSDKKRPLLSSEQLALLFPKQPSMALAKLPGIVQSVKETPSQASHLASSLLKRTKIVLHDAASSAAHQLARKPKAAASEDAPPDNIPQPKAQTQPPKPASPAPLLAPLHPEIQKPTGGSSVALWGSGGKVVNSGDPSGAGALPGRASPAFGASSFVPSTSYAPLPFAMGAQPVTPPPSQNQVTPTNTSGAVNVSVREKSFTPLPSEEALDDFLADLDRRMESPQLQSPRFRLLSRSGSPAGCRYGVPTVGTRHPKDGYSSRERSQSRVLRTGGRNRHGFGVENVPAKCRLSKWGQSTLRGPGTDTPPAYGSFAARSRCHKQPV